MIPDKPIPLYPSLQDESDWQKLLKYSKAMIERCKAATSCRNPTINCKRSSTCSKRLRLATTGACINRGTD